MRKPVIMERDGPSAKVRIRRSFLCLLLLLAALVRGTLCFAAFNEDNKGTSSAQFLKLGVGARAVGMGEAYSAVCRDASAVYWNPGALGDMKGVSGIFTHADLFGELNYEYLGYAQNFRENGTVGLSVQYLSAGRIPETDPGGFETGVKMNPSHTSVALAYGRKFGDIGVGVSAKYIRSRVLETASAFAADAGVLDSIGRKLRLAFVVQNAGGSLKYDQGTDPLPLNIKLGGSYSFSDKLTAGLDVNFPRDNKIYAGLGAEYAVVRADLRFAGRFGYNTRTTGDVSGMNGFSAGLGAMSHNLSLDYAFVPFGSLGAVHRISLSIKFVAKKR